MKQNASKPVGRPKKYTEELADEIFERMIGGEHIVQICNDEAMPGRSTVYRWMDDYPEFGTRIARAREGLADHVAWQILDMASRSTNDTANADRVKLAAWQWHAARLAPKKYSEKVMTEVSGPDGGAIKTESVTRIDTRDLDESQREALKAALSAVVNK
jgi:hypothetical protein